MKATRLKNVLVLLPIIAGTASAKSHKPHEHGAVSISVAIEGLNVNISGEIPGDDAFGFERAAHNDKEKAAIQNALTTLRTKGNELFQFPSESGCTVKKADIKAPQEASILGGSPAHAKNDVKNDAKNAAKKPAKSDEHQDVDADYTFTCLKSPVGGVLKLGLLTAFPSIRTVRVQVISESSQSGTTVHKASDPIKL